MRYFIRILYLYSVIGQVVILRYGRIKTEIRGRGPEGSPVPTFLGKYKEVKSEKTEL